nr:extracellular solute-binding protein [Chitinasiproducens palmae]
MAAAMLCMPAASFAAHAIAQYGEPKYLADFAHFDYVNPDAPKRGMLVLANPNRLTSFDKFNPFTLRGNAAPGIGMLFDSLLVQSSDELASAYGLLADDVSVAPDRRSATFHLNPAARFSNGDRVTANDIKYSFDTLIEKGAPSYRFQYAQVARVVVIDPATVRFEFKTADRELPLLVGGLPVFSPKWGVRADGTRVAFDALGFEMPIGSGPYRVESHDGGATITYRLDPNYWARNLPTRRGMFNFARIRYKLYGDDIARLEAFKAGEYDATVEYRAKSWARGYTGPRFESGQLVKRSFANQNGAGMQGFFMNVRRPLFQDVRVRQALGLALDFEWLNRQLFYDQYTRIDSYFANSPMAAKGMPDAAERALLEPLKGQLDPAVFGPMVTQPSTTPPGSLRANLRAARALLAAAGWQYRNGALRDAAGHPFEFEILDDTGGALGQAAAGYVRNLEKLGIQARFRTIDYALYRKRLDAFEFDMTTLRVPDATLPGNELTDRFGSGAARTPGSDNMIGLASPVVDALIGKVLAADDLDQLTTAVHALDRVLMHGFYVIPHWLATTHRMAYRSTLRYPARLPLYYDAQGWLVQTWWDAAPVRGTAR